MIRYCGDQFANSTIKVHTYLEFKTDSGKEDNVIKHTIKMIKITNPIGFVAFVAVMCKAGKAKTFKKLSGCKLSGVKNCWERQWKEFPNRC